MTRHGPLDEFCWMDLKTHDPSGTATFFSSVLGWDFAVDEQDWRKAVKISAGDHRIGGLSDLAQPVHPPGLPAHIAYYLAVDDVDRRTAVAAENGHRSSCRPSTRGPGPDRHPDRPGGRGRLPLAAAGVRGVAGRPRTGPWPYPFRWLLACEDPERARHFYTGVTTGAPPARAAFAEATTITAPQWELALAVDDLDGVAARARAHGGELVTVAGGLARLSSPEGLTFRIQVPETSRAFLATDRLGCARSRTPTPAHLLALDNDPEVMRYINGGRPTTAESIRERTLPRLLHDHPCTGTRGFWAAEEKATGTFLGWFELRPVDDQDRTVVELGYRLHRAAWGRGYATEGARALVRKGFTDLGAERVTANTMAVNAGSRRVMEKAGLTFLRAYTEDWPDAIEGSEHGEVEYVLTRAEWEKSRA